MSAVENLIPFKPGPDTRRKAPRRSYLENPELLEGLFEEELAAVAA